MRFKFFNELVYSALIVATLICFGCIDAENLTDILPSDIPEVPVEQLPPGEGLSIGAEAPGFSLPDADGNVVSLSDYAGQKVVIVFYATGG